MDIREKLKLLLGLKKLPEGEDMDGFSDEQLAEAAEKVQHVFTAARDEKDVETAEEALEIARTVKAEITRRAEAAAEVEAKLAAMSKEFETPETTDTDPDDANTGDK